jgi:hypothetical protein
MTRNILTNIWTFCVLSAFTIQIVLLAILVVAYFNRNSTLTHALLKWNLNIFLSFVFGFFTCMSYFLIVTNSVETSGEAVNLFIGDLKTNALKSSIWAVVWTSALAIGNVIYQSKIEHSKSRSEILVLYIADLVIMAVAIFIGVSWCYAGLMEKIT